jgi:NADPH2:quinone reductase
MRTLTMVLPSAGEPDALEARFAELEAPGRGQVLVRMEATGVSFAEQQMRRGKYYDQPRFPFVPGYDIVGTVEQLGAGVDGLAVGQRVAALTRVGAWVERIVLDAGDLVPVPQGVEAVAAETAIVNGLTAWRMLHRAAKVRGGQTIVVLGAAGGVGSLLVQLARHAGVRVIGVAGPAQQERVAQLGAIAVDYRAENVRERVVELAPSGVDAVFDHVGGAGIEDSWRMLGAGGTLVSYGTAATKDAPGNPRLPVVKLLGRLLLWNALPNGRHAHFFNLWAGRRNRARFRSESRTDLEHVLGLLADGTLTAQVAGTFALDDAAAALRFAEEGGHTGKVVIVPAARVSGRAGEQRA